MSYVKTQTAFPLTTFQKYLTHTKKFLYNVTSFFLAEKEIYLQSWAKYLDQSRESSRTGQDKKSLISTFTCF